MTETYEPFQVAITAKANPVVTAILPSTSSGSTPSVMWYNVKTMYGADNSGEIDSTTVIQNAINAAHNAGGGVVYFPPGTYKISAALTVYGGIQIRGDGDANTSITQTVANAGCFVGTDMYQFKLSNIQLVGVGTGSGIGIRFTLSSYGNTGYLHFEDIFVQHFGGDGINIDTPIASVFDRVITENNGGNGWNTHSGTYSTSCVWNGCYSKGNGLAGYAHTALAYSDMNGCASVGNAQGYVLTNCQSVTIDGCGAESIASDNFVVSGGADVILLAPRTLSNAHYGIHLTANAKNCVIVGAVEGGPVSSAVNFVITDAGTSCSVMNINNTTANAYNGSVVVLNDGAGNAYVPGTLYLNSGAAISFGATGDTDLYRKGPNSLATDDLFTAYGGIDTTAISTASVAKTGAYTLTLNDNVVRCNTSGGAFTVTLPDSTAASVAGTFFLIKKTDVSGNVVTLVAVGGQTIDGKATATLANQYAFIAVQSDGANWQIVGGASASTPLVGAVAWYNVKTYGADSTGTNDSTTAINNAIAAAGTAGGGIVYFPAGKYVLTSQLNLGATTNNVELLGDGQSSILAPSSGFSAGAVINVVGGDSIGVCDLVIQMPSTTIASNPSCYGMVLQGTPGASNFYIRNVRMMYVNGTAIALWGGGSGVVIANPVFEKLHIVGCVNGVAANGYPGMSTGLNMNDCIIESASNQSIILTDIQDARISNLSCPGLTNGSAAIIVQGATNGVTISNSKFLCGSTTQANLLIQASGSNSPSVVTFTNCIFTKGANCANIMNGKQLSFVGCTFQQANGYGLYTTGTVDQVIITGCTFSGNGAVTQNYFDLYAGSTGSLVVTACNFLTPIGSVAGTVANSCIVNVNSPNTTIDACYFAGGYNTAYNANNRPKNAQGNTGDQLANLGTLTGWFDVRKYGADPSNTNDSTAAIQAAINAANTHYGGGTVYLPAGGYKISAPLALTVGQVSIIGDAGSTWLFPTAAFTGAAAITITNCAHTNVNDIIIGFPSGWSTNSAADGIDVVHSSTCSIDNVLVQNANGYAVSMFSDATAASSFNYLNRVVTAYTKGGVSVQGIAASDTQGIVTITNCYFNNPQTSPAINIQDINTITIDNCVAWGNQSNGLQISGASSGIDVTNCSFGAYGGSVGGGLNIITAGGNSPTDIHISNCIFQSGQYSQINGATTVFINNCEFSWCQSHGLYFGNNSDQITVTNCVFYNNGRTAGAGHYDLACNTGGAYSISGCFFLTAIGTGGTQVQYSILAAGYSTIHGNRFTAAQGSAVNAYPQYFYGNVGDNNSIFQFVQAGPVSGQTNAGRFMGSTGPGGPPAGGTYQVGDYVIDTVGTLWVCTVAGQPGTWKSPDRNIKSVYSYASATVTCTNDNAWHAVGTAVTVNPPVTSDITVYVSTQGLITPTSQIANAKLNICIMLDGAVQNASLPVYFLEYIVSGSGETGPIGGIYKLSGVAAGSHTVSCCYQYNGYANGATVTGVAVDAMVTPT